MERNDSVEVSELKAFLKEFTAETDRAAVILGGAKLDTLLHELLARFLVPLRSSKDTFLEGETGLTFNGKIDAAYRLGLIDCQFHRALHLVRKVRNRFAHTLGPISLASGTVGEWAREFVRPIKGSEVYRFLANVKQFAMLNQTSRDFRIALGVCSLRLTAAIRRVAPVSSARATPLVGSLGSVTKVNA